MSRNSLFFNKRPKSLISTWLGKRKQVDPTKRKTNKLYQRYSKKAKTV